ncbi:MAG: hypothetical protein R2780_15450 [Crocinitomicaceae bacterium]
MIFNDRLYFSSLQPDSINYQEEVYDSEYSIEIYMADQQDSIFNNVLILEDVTQRGFNTANGSFSPDGKRFLFFSL